MNMRSAPSQIALLDALTFDYQTTRQLAKIVWPTWEPWQNAIERVHAVIRLLRRRGIRIDNLPGYGYRLAEDQ